MARGAASSSGKNGAPGGINPHAFGVLIVLWTIAQRSISLV